MTVIYDLVKFTIESVSWDLLTPCGTRLTDFVTHARKIVDDVLVFKIIPLHSCLFRNLHVALSLFPPPVCLPIFLSLTVLLCWSLSRPFWTKEQLLLWFKDRSKVFDIPKTSQNSWSWLKLFLDEGTFIFWDPRNNVWGPIFTHKAPPLYPTQPPPHTNLDRGQIEIFVLLCITRLKGYVCFCLICRTEQKFYFDLSYTQHNTNRLITKCHVYKHEIEKCPQKTWKYKWVSA